MSVSRLGDTGDTIIEVLICMAIVGFSVSTSYSIARRSLYKIRQAEEHGQSLQLGKQQIERFKAYLSLNPAKSTDEANRPGSFVLSAGTHFGFCIYHTTGGLLQFMEIDTDPADPRCAVNQAGVYYCEVNPPCTTVPSSTTVDNAGYPYRAGIAWWPAGGAGGGKKYQFYGTAGRFAVNGDTSNVQHFDAISLPFRIIQ